MEVYNSNPQNTTRTLALALIGNYQPEHRECRDCLIPIPTGELCNECSAWREAYDAIAAARRALDRRASR